MTDQSSRYADALRLLLIASATDNQHPDFGILLNPEGDLNWSAVHTYLTDVLDLGMTAEQAIADLNDAPPGALDAPTSGLEGCTEPPLPFPGVPDQPQPE